MACALTGDADFRPPLRCPCPPKGHFRRSAGHVTKHLPVRRCAASLLLLLAAVGCPSGTVTPTGPSELIVNAPIPGSGTTHLDCSWTQFGQNAAHTGTACAPAQGFTTVLATVTFDPFIEQEVLDAKAQSGQAALSVHYQAPLVTGDDVYLETKGGSYTGCTNFLTNSQGFTIPESSDGGPCGQNAWDSQVWSESYYRWEAGALVKVASFESDWKPEPGDLVIWEPVFHAALDGNVLWVPGAGGTVYQVDRTTMLKLAQVNPFGAVLDAQHLRGRPHHRRPGRHRALQRRPRRRGLVRRERHAGPHRSRRRDGAYRVLLGAHGKPAGA